MFCHQCEQTAPGTGCTKIGVCGKQPDVAALQDLLVYALKGLSQYAIGARKKGITDTKVDIFTVKALFSTLTNVDFDSDRFVALINECVALRENLKAKAGISIDGGPASPTMVAEAEPQQPPPQPRPAVAERPREDGPPFVAAASPKLLKAPPPPARPFDLGAIARVLNTASAVPVPPPRRPLMQASAGERTLYFADRETPALRLLRGDPFAQVIGGDSR